MSARIADDTVPNEGEGVSDETEPAEEYELNQATDERDGHGGESVAEAIGDDES